LKEHTLCLDGYERNEDETIINTSPNSWGSDISQFECSVSQKSPFPIYISEEESNSCSKCDFSNVLTTFSHSTENLFKNQNNNFVIYPIIFGSLFFCQIVGDSFNSPGRFEGYFVRLTMKALIRRQKRANKECINKIDKHTTNYIGGKAVEEKYKIKKKVSIKNKTREKETKEIPSSGNFLSFTNKSIINSKGLSPTSKKIANFEALIQEPDLLHDFFDSLPSYIPKKSFPTWILLNTTLRCQINKNFESQHELKSIKNQLYNLDFTNMLQKSKTLVNNPEEVLTTILSDRETSSALNKTYINNFLNEASKDHMLMNKHIQNPTVSEILIKLQTIAYKTSDFKPC
jgi:hypothetical protein